MCEENLIVLNEYFYSTISSAEEGLVEPDGLSVPRKLERKPGPKKTTVRTSVADCDERKVASKGERRRKPKIQTSIDTNAKRTRVQTHRFVPPLENSRKPQKVMPFGNLEQGKSAQSASTAAKSNTAAHTKR
jgi:hypothetical protein